MRPVTAPSSALLLAVTLSACGGTDVDPGLPPDAGTDASHDAGLPPDPPPFRYDAGFAPRPDASFEGYPLDDTLSIFHVQLEATHNSYHLRPERPIPAWDYEHAPLDVQLDEQGVRGLELDLNWDPSIGAHRVFHVAALDHRSSCDLFVECLSIIRAWSDTHPALHPLVVHVEVKGAVTASVRAARMRAIDDEIRSVWPEDLVITPDRVRAGHATLPAALAAQGWPTLGETRGHVLFVMDDSGDKRAAYLEGAPNLEGRMMFVDSRPGDAFAAYAIINDARATERIADALDAGLLVRVFGEDAAALAGDPSVLEHALASGAHVISSDHPAPVPETSFFVEIPGGTPSRCNPFTAPAECTSRAIEDR